VLENNRSVANLPPSPAAEKFTNRGDHISVSVMTEYLSIERHAFWITVCNVIWRRSIIRSIAKAHKLIMEKTDHRVTSSVCKNVLILPVMLG